MFVRFSLLDDIAKEVHMFHTIQLSKADPTPLYIQLASEMSKLIQADVLPCGTKLPSIRILSKQLSINRDTVVSAYNLLESQGLVEAHVGKGTYIASLPITPHTSAPFGEAHNIYCSSLGFSKELFPVSLCKELSDMILSKEGWNAFCDPFNRERNLLKQSAYHFLEEIGLNASSAQVRIIKHFTDFLSILFKYSSKQGLCIEALSDLTYSCYLRSIGAKIYEVPLTTEGLSLEALEKHLHSGNIGYIFLSSYLQNPTGICYSADNKRQIIELAERYDCYIIEDGTLSDFYASPLFPLFNHLSKDRVIYIYHFCKVYLPYLSYSFVLLPSDKLKCIPDKMQCSFNEYLLHYYLESSFLKDHKRMMIASCNEKYARLLLGLSSLKDKIKLYAANGGLFFWLKPLTVSPEQICELFIHHNIIIAPGTLFTSSNKTSYFRLSITHLTLSDIDNLLELLKKL